MDAQESMLVEKRIVGNDGTPWVVCLPNGEDLVSGQLVLFPDGKIGQIQKSKSNAERLIVIKTGLISGLIPTLQSIPLSTPAARPTKSI